MTGYAMIYPGHSRMDEQQCCQNPDVNEFHIEHWDQVSFMKDQCNEICIHKWIESQKAGYDLGATAIKDWINKYAKDFREYAMKSGKYIKK